MTSADAGWERGLLSPSKVRLAPRTGFALSLDDDRAVIRGGYGMFLNQWAYSVQTAFARNLPFFYTKQVDVPADQRTPSFQTSNILTADPTGVAGADIMDHDYAVEYTQTWSGGLQYRVRPSTMVEASYMGSWTLGADNAHRPQRPGARRRLDSGAAADSAARVRSARSASTASRSITADVQGGAAAAEQYAFNVSYTLSSSIDDASSPGATEAETNFPQNVRNIFDETGEWAHSSFDHRHLFVASGPISSASAGQDGSRKRSLAAGG